MIWWQSEQEQGPCEVRKGKFGGACETDRDREESLLLASGMWTGTKRKLGEQVMARDQRSVGWEGEGRNGRMENGEKTEVEEKKREREREGDNRNGTGWTSGKGWLNP